MKKLVSLTPEAEKAFVSYFKKEEYKKGEMLFEQGEDYETIFQSRYVTLCNMVIV